jgi:hypothetical protein
MSGRRSLSVGLGAMRLADQPLTSAAISVTIIMLRLGVKTIFISCETPGDIGSVVHA